VLVRAAQVLRLGSAGATAVAAAVTRASTTVIKLRPASQGLGDRPRQAADYSARPPVQTCRFYPYVSLDNATTVTVARRPAASSTMVVMVEVRCTPERFQPHTTACQLAESAHPATMARWRRVLKQACVSRGAGMLQGRPRLNRPAS
jgi:hypothetical protein